MQHKSIEILGLPISNITRHTLLKDVHMVTEKKGQNLFIVTANPEILMAAKASSAYKKAILQADYIIPDGSGVMKASNILGQPLQEKIPGYDLLHTFLDYASEHRKSVYFFGAQEGIANAAAINAQSLYPHIQIAGVKHGYSGLGKNIASEIASTTPDFVFVGLGAPLQENWIAEFRSLFPHSVLMGVGGSFDVLSGNTKRASQFWLDRNLEWLHRLITQPVRAKRMAKLPLFIVEIYKQKWFSSNNNSRN